MNPAITSAPSGKKAVSDPQRGKPSPLMQLHDREGVEYGSRNVLADPELREGVKQFSSWPTIPQVRRL